MRGGLTSATTDPATIRQWWLRWPGANVALRTGAVSGLVIVDIDPAHGGADTLQALIDRYGPLPEGPVVGTGSGGRHLYFAHPGGIIRNDTGRRLGPGLDIRGDGGYVIAPPSRHTSGTLYQWNGLDRTLPYLPDWLLTRLREPWRPARPPRVPAQAPSPHRRSAWAASALEREAARVAAATEGNRNATLNRSAFSLGQIVGGGALEAGDVEATLLDRALSVGLSEREARATIASGLSAGVHQPRGPASSTIDLRTIALQGLPTSRRPVAPTRQAPTVDVPGTH